MAGHRKRTHAEDIKLGKRRALREIKELVGEDSDLFKQIKEKVYPKPKRKRKRPDLKKYRSPSVFIKAEINTQKEASKHAVLIQCILNLPRDSEWYRVRGSQNLSAKGRQKLKHAIQERMRYFGFKSPQIRYHLAWDGICVKWASPEEMKQYALDSTYVYRWKNTEERKAMYGRQCKIIADGPNTTTKKIQFLDNQETAMVDIKALARVSRPKARK